MVKQVFLVLAATQLSAEGVNSWYGNRGEVFVIPPCPKQVERLLDETFGTPDDDRVLIFHLDPKDSLRNWGWFLELLSSERYAPTIVRV